MRLYTHRGVAHYIQTRKGHIDELGFKDYLVNNYLIPDNVPCAQEVIKPLREFIDKTINQVKIGVYQDMSLGKAYCVVVPRLNGALPEDAVIVRKGLPNLMVVQDELERYSPGTVISTSVALSTGWITVSGIRYKLVETKNTIYLLLPTPF